ncbi:MAG: DUF4956 domain-containing protein [Bacteroidetes bacterium CG23_combo_of_CG06-09_8_20_14_all_32_9]|nr:MAG: DUF4956 domain-containing protein [Bacteroidetes bacterium CG23_combo_of_CG06-09_8_20_14_all_32_9]
MISTKNVITFLLFLFLLAPAKISIAQNIEDEIVQQDKADVKVKKSDKKKNKNIVEKNIVEINEKFFINLGINVATVLLIICLIYYPNNKRNMEYVFTFIIFNFVIFLLTFVLNKVKISMGAAFGLFAIFSMLRYRTEGISMKNMTYLFIFIAIGLISAIQLEYYELAILNGLIVVVTFIIDGNILIKQALSKDVQYENIELIKPEKEKELIQDLKTRTGLNIRRITIRKIDFLRDTAIIRIYYRE